MISPTLYGTVYFNYNFMPYENAEVVIYDSYQEDIKALSFSEFLQYYNYSEFLRAPHDPPLPAHISYQAVNRKEIPVLKLDKKAVILLNFNLSLTWNNLQHMTDGWREQLVDNSLLLKLLNRDEFLDTFKEIVPSLSDRQFVEFCVFVNTTGLCLVVRKEPEDSLEDVYKEIKDFYYHMKDSSELIYYIDLIENNNRTPLLCAVGDDDEFLKPTFFKEQGVLQFLHDCNYYSPFSFLRSSALAVQFNPHGNIVVFHTETSRTEAFILEEYFKKRLNNQFGDFSNFLSRLYGTLSVISERPMIDKINMELPLLWLSNEKYRISEGTMYYTIV